MVCSPVSVLISVYANEDAEHLRLALNSVLEQTYPPNEIVLVKDGLLTSSLDSVIDEMKDYHPEMFKTVSLSENRGLGKALQIGLEHCTDGLVARMDADDISVSDRFEKQVAFMSENPDVDVVGGYIGEFEDDDGRIQNVREVPNQPKTIAKKARFRSPLNHPTVMFRREAVRSVGGYQDRRLMQDYDLWVRLLVNDYKLANIPEILVKSRAGRELYQRRGGWDYARMELQLQRAFLEIGFISWPIFVFNLVLRLPIRLLPNRVRAFLYESVLRE